MLHLETLLLGGFVESTKNLRNPAKKHLIGTHSKIPTIWCTTISQKCCNLTPICHSLRRASICILLKDRPQKSALPPKSNSECIPRVWLLNMKHVTAERAAVLYTRAVAKRAIYQIVSVFQKLMRTSCRISLSKSLKAPCSWRKTMACEGASFTAGKKLVVFSRCLCSACCRNLLRRYEKKDSYNCYNSLHRSVLQYSTCITNWY